MSTYNPRLTTLSTVVIVMDMNTWTPVFSKIVDSSLWAEPDHVCKVFITMLALKDADQVVRHNAYAIARKCWPADLNGEAQVLAAFKILSSPDTRRLEPQPYGGRRIEKTPDGWLILNGQAYEDMMRSINRRAYKAAKQSEYRSRKKVAARAVIPGESAYQKLVSDGATDGELDRHITSSLPEPCQLSPTVSGGKKAWKITNPGANPPPG